MPMRETTNDLDARIAHLLQSEFAGRLVQARLADDDGRRQDRAVMTGLRARRAEHLRDAALLEEDTWMEG